MLTITRPQIYFGELPSTFALAPSRQREFDHPAREEVIAAGDTFRAAAREQLMAWGARHNVTVVAQDRLTGEVRMVAHANVEALEKTPGAQGLIGELKAQAIAAKTARSPS